MVAVVKGELSDIRAFGIHDEDLPVAGAFAGKRDLAGVAASHPAPREQQSSGKNGKESHGPVCLGWPHNQRVQWCRGLTMTRTEIQYLDNAGSAGGTLVRRETALGLSGVQ